MHVCSFKTDNNTPQRLLCCAEQNAAAFPAGSQYWHVLLVSHGALHALGCNQANSGNRMLLLLLLLYGLLQQSLPHILHMHAYG
jgi:hypothetical protein